MLEMLPRPKLRAIVGEEVEAIMSNPDLVADRTKIRNRKPLRSLSLGAGGAIDCPGIDGGPWRVRPAQARCRGLCRHRLGTAKCV